MEFAHIDHPIRHYDRTCPACEIEALNRRIAELEEYARNESKRTALIERLMNRISELELAGENNAP